MEKYLRFRLSLGRTANKNTTTTTWRPRTYTDNNDGNTIITEGKNVRWKKNNSKLNKYIITVQMKPKNGLAAVEKWEN